MMIAKMKLSRDPVFTRPVVSLTCTEIVSPLFYLHYFVFEILEFEPFDEDDTEYYQHN